MTTPDSTDRTPARDRRWSSTTGDTDALNAARVDRDRAEAIVEVMRQKVRERKDTAAALSIALFNVHCAAER